MTDRSEFIFSLITKIFIPVILFLTFAMGLIVATRAHADGWEHGGHEGHEWGERGEGWERGHDDGERRSRGKAKGVALAENPLYMEECSACHMAYQPWLLPARSWERIMDSAGDHFGEDLALEDSASAEIRAYLIENSAENTRVRNELAGQRGKIMRKLRGADPDRIRDVPYIRKEHRKIRPEVFERPSVSSFANCAACHRTAGRGDYDEDNVRIPGK
ncbi:MAG: diheme cytochrome c [Thermodesulfobacteriota bacterium]